MPTRLSRDFVNAIADRDEAALRALVRPDLLFRACSPLDSWETFTRDDFVRILFTDFFPPECRIIAVHRLDIDVIGDMQVVGYRLEVERGGRTYLIQQQGFLEIQDEVVSTALLVGSGFHDEAKDL